MIGDNGEYKLGCKEGVKKHSALQARQRETFLRGGLWLPGPSALLWSSLATILGAGGGSVPKAGFVEMPVRAEDEHMAPC